MVLLAKVQDEAGHRQYLYHAAKTLGISRDEMIDALHEDRAQYASVFNYPTLGWAVVGSISWLVDGAAIMKQTMLAHGTYGPYSRAMVRICAEEGFHRQQGAGDDHPLCPGALTLQRQMAQEAIDPLVVTGAEGVRPRRQVGQHAAAGALGDKAQVQRPVAVTGVP